MSSPALQIEAKKSASLCLTNTHIANMHILFLFTLFKKMKRGCEHVLIESMIISLIDAYLEVEGVRLTL